ncbi:hypothetical protein [Mucilaginibacter pedocola]|uniref:hypothetical protein n=1 Tax=Mucilaginibacter pedocola TaxID=1792845 RepID=UPI0012DD9E1E|nr:hypothetical protein [Mucilaginibacter pedocola]
MTQTLKNGNPLWDSLTPEQQLGVLDAYEESEDDKNLISLDEIKEKYANWF